MEKVWDPYTWTISAALDKSLPYWIVGTTSGPALTLKMLE